jgi:hypothetical protein
MPEGTQDRVIYTPVLRVSGPPPIGGDKYSPADGCGRGVFIVRSFHASTGIFKRA